MNKDNLEYCNICDKMYLCTNHKKHIKSSKHIRELHLKELCEENVIYDLYSLSVVNEKPDDDVFYIPIDSE